MKLNELTGNHFRPLIQSSVRVDMSGGEGLELTLIEVADPFPAPAGQARRPFSLVYRGPLRRFLPQGLYPLAHPGLGTLEIFIVPVRQDADGFIYQAVFN